MSSCSVLVMLFNISTLQSCIGNPDYTESDALALLKYNPHMSGLSGISMYLLQ